MNRLPTLLAIATLEATAISLPLLALGMVGLPWAEVLALVLLSALATWQIEGRVAEGRQRRALVATMVALALGASALRLGGLGALLGSLAPRSERFVLAYGVLVESLFACWRGTRLANYTQPSVARTFSLGVLLSIVALLLRAFAQDDEAGRAAALTAQLVLLVGSGLLAQALAREEEENDDSPRGWSGRWMATLAGAIAAVALLGLAISALFGDQMGDVLAQAYAALSLVVLIVLSPFLLLIGVVVSWLLSLLPNGVQFPTLPILAQPSPLEELTRGLLPEGTPPWLEFSVVWLVGLLPLALLALLIALAKRRLRGGPRDEERESLLSAGEVLGDLRALLAGLAGRGARKRAGLQAALEALRGRDPASRARRAYIHMLLALEARERPRPPAATPAEFAPAASATLPAAATAVDALTAAYERARYGAASEADAERAEDALGQIRDQETK
jgi:hypothetical protein